MSEIKPVYKAAILVFILVAGLFLLFMPKAQQEDDPDVQKGIIQIGKVAPDFEYPDLSGRNIRLSDYRGSVVLVNIWATWCPPCVSEMPSIEALYQKLKGEKFEILAVSIDRQGSAAVAPFMGKYRLAFPALLDPQGTISVPYQATGVPESFIIDKKGVLLKKIVGPINWQSPEAIRFFQDLIQQPD